MVRSQSNPGVLTTLRRGLEVLEAIAEGNGDVTAKALSTQLGLSRGTCYHLLRTLQDQGYVVRVPGGRFALGERLAFLGERMRARMSPSADLADAMRTVATRLDETTTVAGWYGEEIVVQSSIEGSHPVSVRPLEVGYSSHPHARALSKAVLAYLPASAVRTITARHGLTALTPSTITDVQALLEQLAQAARDGYATDREEFVDGVCGVAAPVFDSGGFPAASIGLSIPTARFDSKLAAATEALLAASRKASFALGWRDGSPKDRPRLRPSAKPSAQRVAGRARRRR